MRIATFNIRHGLSASGALDLQLLATTCAELDADVLGLQEVDKWMRRSVWARMARRLAKQTGMAYCFAPALHRGVIGSYGNALLVRGTITATESVRLVGGGEPRVALIAEVVVDGQRLGVGVTHLDNRANDQLGQLDKVLEALSRRRGALVLMGDLNRSAEQVAPMLAEVGFELVIGGPTYPAHAPRHQIDHVAVSGMCVVQAWVPEVLVSDHRPLVVETKVCQQT